MGMGRNPPTPPREGGGTTSGTPKVDNSAQLEPDWSISKINQIVTKYKSIKTNQSKLKPLEFLSSLIFL